ncbi:hypothetical protein ABT168_39540, partial [Streptomyces sp. NPDC001793]
MTVGARGRTPARSTALLAAAAATRAGYEALRRRPPGGAARWERKNHAGRTVTLHAGPAAALGTALAATAPGESPPDGVLADLTDVFAQ